MPAASLIHNKYSPAMASIHPSQIEAEALCPMKIPRTGTSTRYRLVTKAALPAVVVTSPICWREAAINRTVPASIPGRRASLNSVDRDCVLSRKTNNRGSSDRPPNINRTPLKVKGPTCSIPTLWATKASPQMAATSSSKRFDLITLTSGLPSWLDRILAEAQMY